MKPWLMFKNRDFDPQQVLIKRAKNVNWRDINGQLDLQQLLPWNEQALVDDFGLDILFHSMADEDNFLFEVAKTAVLSGVTDSDTIRYRQGILKDCLEHEQIVRDIYSLTIEAIERERREFWGFFSTDRPDFTLHHCISKLAMFSEMLRRLRNIADQHRNEFHSEGFNNFFGMLQEELSDEYLDLVAGHLEQLKFKDGILVSADLGYGSKGTNYILHTPPEDDRNWLIRLLFSRKLPGYTYEIDPRDESGHRALAELEHKSINLVANAVAQSADHVLCFFHALRTEMAFYIGCLNLKTKLDGLQEPVCFPDPLPRSDRRMSFSELYDVNLALAGGEKVVGNDLNTDGKDIFIITGANTGGKSTFMRSLGIAQLLMQAGMYVPAQSFSAGICDGMFTHFKREEDTTMESGKLDEELGRMYTIVKHVNPKSMVLLNESFAATNEREGSEITRQITSALADSGVKVIFVTHQYEFARSYYEEDRDDVLYLRAERLEDGTRTFRIIEGKPLQTSYGEDLYKEIFE